MEVEKAEMEAPKLNSQNGTSLINSGLSHSGHKSSKFDPSQHRNEKIDLCFYYNLIVLAIPVLTSQPYSPRGPQQKFVSLLYHQFPVSVNNTIAHSFLGKFLTFI